MDITFHYPPELLNLLVDTIPRLVRGKADVLLFFRGAGVPARRMADLQAKLAVDKNSVGKFEMARTLLTRLNEDGEPALAQRREVLRRVVQFEDFSTCWDNERLKAQGLVGQVRQLVNVKDSFTRMSQEREAERDKAKRVYEAKAVELQQRHAELERVKTDLNALFADADPWRRGRKLEGVLNRLFAAAQILVREAFTLRGSDSEGVIEQIDGVVEIDTSLYLVEMKWHVDQLGPGDVGQHLVRAFTRGGVRALFISSSGFTPAAINTCKDALGKIIVVLCGLEEIVRLLATGTDLREYLRAKIHRAMIEKEPLYQPGF
jgi:hypothetical protein